MLTATNFVFGTTNFRTSSAISRDGEAAEYLVGQPVRESFNQGGGATFDKIPRHRADGGIIDGVPDVVRHAVESSLCGQIVIEIERRWAAPRSFSVTPTRAKTCNCSTRIQSCDSGALPTFIGLT